jgi:hypothetical protein
MPYLNTKSLAVVHSNIPGSAEKIRLAQEIRSHAARLNACTVTAGFDGFVDTLVKVIRHRPPTLPAELFQTIAEFGDYVKEKTHGSFSLEVEERSIKIGGNMPILANALGELGITVNCVGALGYPEPARVFDSLSCRCKKFSYAQPGTSTALEFNDGKVMLGNMGELNVMTWRVVKERIGIKILLEQYDKSNLICLVNWSEIESSGDIWAGYFQDVVRNGTKAEKLFFFDLSDCSKRSENDIRGVADLISSFAGFGRVALGLNRNEASVLYRALIGSAESAIEEIAVRLFEKLNIESLLIHSAKDAIAVNSKTQAVVPGFFTPSPKLSTGAGDNFNAGFNAGRLMGISLDQCVLLGHAVSGIYIRTGKSPTLPEVADFLEIESK